METAVLQVNREYPKYLALLGPLVFGKYLLSGIPLWCALPSLLGLCFIFELLVDSRLPHGT